MTEDAVPVRFSRRIQRKANLTPVRVSVKKKTRRSVVKKRTSRTNTSLFKATRKEKVGTKSKSENNTKQTSVQNFSVQKVTEKAKVGKKSKLEKNFNQISKQSSQGLKSENHKRSGKKLTEIFDQKRNTRSSLIASQDNLTKNEKQQNLELDLHRKGKENFENKKHKKSTDNIIHPVHSSIRVSKSSLLAEDKELSKKLIDSKLKSSGVKNTTQKKSALQVTSISPKSVLTLKTGKSLQTPRPLKGKKSTKLSTESLNQEISLDSPISKSLFLTQSPDKCTRKTRQAGNQKSARLSKGSNQSSFPSSGISLNTSAFHSIHETSHPKKHSEKRNSTRLSKGPSQSSILSSGISVNTSAFHSIFETPHPEKYSEKRKPSRISEPTSLRALNKELSLSTPVSVLGKNRDSMLSKSSQLNKDAELLTANNPLRKRGRPKLSNKEITNEAPEKLKSSLNKELSLSTPVSVLGKNQDSMLSKSSQLNKDAELPTAKNPLGKRGRPKLSHKKITNDAHEKLKSSQGRQKKALENFKLPLSKVNNNLPLDILSTPDFAAIHVKSASEKCLPKPSLKSSKRKLHHSATENLVLSEEVQDAKKRKKSAGDNVCVDNSTSPSKYRTMKKSICAGKTYFMKTLKENENSGSDQMNRINNNCEIDVITDVFQEKQSQRARSMTNKNKINCLSTFTESKGKSNCNQKWKPEKSIIPSLIPQKEYDASCSDTDSERETSQGKEDTEKDQTRYLTTIVNAKSNLAIKEDFLSSNLNTMKRRRTKTAPSKTNESNDGVLLIDKGTSSAYQKMRLIKTITPVKFVMNMNRKPMLLNSLEKEFSQLPIDNLTGNKGASTPLSDGKRLFKNKSTPYKGRKKIHSWPLGNGLSSKTSDDFPNLAVKGTLKNKRWLLNHLKETNADYEDDIFENQHLDQYKNFHFGEESDGSSVNIATPKFDCILTPALPKKTPHFKDCISPTELLQARKAAEEYLYRRNKKRKSGDKPSSSGKKTSMNKKNTKQDIPEKRKLDFEETVNKLMEVQKILEKDANIGDEEEDSYFSDASN